MRGPIHFYLTFNPFLNQELEPGYTQAHQFLNYLKDRPGIKGKAPYAYWGKMIAKDRSPKIDIEKLNEVVISNKEIGHSTHLYISDFHFLWVAKVTEVKSSINKDFKTLEFYKDKNVECWFKIEDFALLEYTQEGTCEHLSHLYMDNQYSEMKIDGLSPYTSGIKYPAFVQDIGEEEHFDQLETGIRLMDSIKKVANETLLERVLYNLQHYLFPAGLYSKISHAARLEIEAAELDMLEHRHHNIKRNAFSYLKALELILNDLIIGHLKRKGEGENLWVSTATMPPKLYLFDEKDDLIPISKFHKTYSIGQLFFLVERCQRQGHFSFKKAFAGKKTFLNFLLKDVIPFVRKSQLIEIRGVFAHQDSSQVSQEDANAVRNMIMGIGGQGLIAKLYMEFYKEEFENLHKVMGQYTKEEGRTNKVPSRKLKIAS